MKSVRVQKVASRPRKAPAPERVKNPAPGSQSSASLLKTVLLTVSGMSPAIITETVWALANPPTGQEPVIPDEVVVITTTRGAEDLRRDLLTARGDWGGRTVWESLRDAVLGKIKDKNPNSEIRKRRAERLQLATPRLIELPDTKRGIKQAAIDLRSAADNAAAADFILEEVRRLAENPDIRIIASIAGGRKTMGALLYAAMSLLGRESDRVTHVLVNEPFDVCRGFFYPAQPVRELAVGAGDRACTVCATDARIELADVPFVPLRNLFERDLVKKPGRFVALVERCFHRVAELARREVELEVCEDRPEIIVNKTPVPLSVPEYVLLRHLAEACQAGRPAIDGYDAAAGAVVETAKRIHAGHDENDFSDWRYKALPAGKGYEEINERWITKRLDSIRTKLRQAGAGAAALVPLLPERGRFSLDLPPASITLRD
jgi:CRISPR-associated protein (TIGR02584 family)